MADNIDLRKDEDPMSEESDIENYKLLLSPIEPKDNPDNKKVEIHTEHPLEEEDDEKTSTHSQGHKVALAKQPTKIDIVTQQKTTLGNSLTKATKHLP
jgi:hypothetical protein